MGKFCEHILHAVYDALADRGEGHQGGEDGAREFEDAIARCFHVGEVGFAEVLAEGVEGEVDALGAVVFAIVFDQGDVFGPDVGVVAPHVADMFEEVEFCDGLGLVADADAAEQDEVVVVVFSGEVVVFVAGVEGLG
ncbi:MAG: hypothetical protein HC860_21180 [Alkalinema sp. RU_4_3]|nr:hypothetical protein [Alkalinema sp. RU_4_3]